jgi:hypothetical protein
MDLPAHHIATSSARFHIPLCPRQSMCCNTLSLIPPLRNIHSSRSPFLHLPPTFNTTVHRHLDTFPYMLFAQHHPYLSLSNFIQSQGRFLRTSYFPLGFHFSLKHYNRGFIHFVLNPIRCTMLLVTYNLDSASTTFRLDYASPTTGLDFVSSTSLDLASTPYIYHQSKSPSYTLSMVHCPFDLSFHYYCLDGPHYLFELSDVVWHFRGLLHYGNDLSMSLRTY